MLIAQRPTLTEETIFADSGHAGAWKAFREADDILRDTLRCFDHGAIEEGGLTAIARLIDLDATTLEIGLVERLDRF